MTNEAGGPKEKIQALLAEYAGLRTESVHRNNNLFQLASVMAVLIGLAVARQSYDFRFWLIAAASILFCVALGWKIHRDVVIAAQRMQEIEARVNELVGEKVMVWESHWGGYASGYLRRRRPVQFGKDSN